MIPAAEQDRSSPPYAPLSHLVVQNQRLVEATSDPFDLGPDLLFPHTGISPLLPSQPLEDPPAVVISVSDPAQRTLPPSKPGSRSGSSERSTGGSWWDNYNDRSSYELGEEQFWSCDRNIRKTPIVSTDISELAFTSSDSEPSDEEPVFHINTMAPSTACTEAAKALVKAKNVLQVRIDMLDPDEIDSSYLHTITEELDGIRNLLQEFMVLIMTFLDDFSSELESSVVTSLQEESTKAKKSVIEHKKLVWTKFNAINPVKPLTYFETPNIASL